MTEINKILALELNKNPNLTAREFGVIRNKKGK